MSFARMSASPLPTDSENDFSRLLSCPGGLPRSTSQIEDGGINYIFMTFKFGGTWVKVKNQERMKYDGGKQRTIKLQKCIINFSLILQEINRICPWLKGQNFEIYYHINGTSPKSYKAMLSDDDTKEMMQQLKESDRAEIIIIIQGGNEEWNRPSGGSLTVHCADDGVLSIGKQFDSLKSFKIVLHSQAIIHNFGLKIKASDKTRVIATCAYRGCSWKIRASVCADGQTFEVRSLESLHTCPGVNRAGNKQATSSWVANEIQDIVKKYPDIPPKQLNHTLETNYGLSLPYKKLWRAREMARDMIFGSADENYNRVPMLRAEIY